VAKGYRKASHNLDLLSPNEETGVKRRIPQMVVPATAPRIWFWMEGPARCFCVDDDDDDDDDDELEVDGAVEDSLDLSVANARPAKNAGKRK
jgi:hypothetical protein